MYNAIKNPINAHLIGLSLYYISVAIRHYRQRLEGLEDHREKTSFVVVTGKFNIRFVASYPV